mmetsp:Transcript_43104/g.134695  ORF Transcript_43104/g.134695 Transcript_43104/m.134695 type:complete len:228 (+) Transcript_43104:121-804(+)
MISKAAQKRKHKQSCCQAKSGCPPTSTQCRASMGPKKWPAPLTDRLNQSMLWFASNQEPSGRQCCCMAPRPRASLRYMVGKTTVVATSSMTPDWVLKKSQDPKTPTMASDLIQPTRLRRSRSVPCTTLSGMDVRKVRPTDMPTLDSSQAYSLCKSITAAAWTPATLMARAVLMRMLPTITARFDMSILAFAPGSPRAESSEDILVEGVSVVDATPSAFAAGSLSDRM